MRVWIDIDNEPQVQYLLPFREVFERLGASVVLTARDNGITSELIQGAGERAVVVGSEFGRARWKKASGVVRRAWALRRVIRGDDWPDLLLSSSRSAALLAWRLGTPSFVICDYEYVELSLFRRLGTHVFFPEVIGSAPFLARGFSESQLLPFRGLKEDISFSRLLRDHVVSPDPFPEADGRRLVRVLVRPPHEESHYFKPGSLSLTRLLLSFLAARNDVRVIYSPRMDRQRAYVGELRWRTPPVVLDPPLPTLTLLEHVDLVVTGGGTMAREAAYLGVPAYSVFEGRLGGVDHYLADEGRLVLLGATDDFSQLKIERLGQCTPMPHQSGLVEEIAVRALVRARR